MRRLIDDYDVSAAATASSDPPSQRLRGFAEFAVLTQVHASLTPTRETSRLVVHSLRYQHAENAALRAHVGAPDGVSGVIVRSVPKLSNLHGRLQVRA